MDNSDVYAQAQALAQESTEDSLEQAMLLYRSIRGWQDADQQYVSCRTRLGRMRWQKESVLLKAEEDRFEAQVARWKRTAIALLLVVLLGIAAVTTITLIRFKRYNKAEELYTAGEYERAAAAFQTMGDYQDSRVKVFLSAVELYKAKRYEQALPYFVWLDGYIDNGYYLEKCQERLAALGESK